MNAENGSFRSDTSQHYFHIVINCNCLCRTVTALIWYIIFFMLNRRRHEALSSLGQTLAPVDVWTSGNRQRRLQQKISMDLRGDSEGPTSAIVVEETDGPEFTQYVCEWLLNAWIWIIAGH